MDYDRSLLSLFEHTHICHISGLLSHHGLHHAVHYDFDYDGKHQQYGHGLTIAKYRIQLFLKDRLLALYTLGTLYALGNMISEYNTCGYRYQYYFV